MPRRYILTASERVLVAIPTDETALIRLYTLSEQDLSVIKQRRGDANRLGFAVLLCCLRYPGYALPAGEDPLGNDAAERLPATPGIAVPPAMPERAVGA